MRAMLADVLDALARVPELEQVLVVTANPLARELEGDPRIRVLHDDREAGQSAAAQIGIAHARDDGFERALLVPGDAPLLDPAELSGLLARPEPLVIVPDRHGTGTNGLLSAPVDAFEPAFGPGQPRPPRGGRPGHGPALGDRPPPLPGPGRGHARGPRGHDGADRRRARDPGGAAAPVATRVSLSATALEGLPEVERGRRPGRAPGRRRARRPRCRRRAGGGAQGGLEGRGPGARPGLGSSPASARATWRPSTARTRGWCRWSWTSRPSCSARTTAC